MWLLIPEILTGCFTGQVQRYHIFSWCRCSYVNEGKSAGLPGVLVHTIMVLGRPSHELRHPVPTTEAIIMRKSNQGRAVGRGLRHSHQAEVGGLSGVG